MFTAIILDLFNSFFHDIFFYSGDNSTILSIKSNTKKKLKLYKDNNLHVST